MLAGMTPTAKDLVLGNPRLGVARISCVPVPGSYDHKRFHASLCLGRPFAGEAPVPVWDFLIERTDGSMVRFHTSSHTDSKGGQLPAPHPNPGFIPV